MLKTLIVEDNSFFRLSLKAMLDEHFQNMDIVEADSGEDALAKFANYHPQLVFMDVTLPDANGLELTRQIKAISQPVVVVVLTAHESREYREAALQAGADYFFSKGEVCGADILALVDAAFPVACH